MQTTTINDTRACSTDGLISIHPVDARAIVVEIDEVAAAMAACYDHLPGKAKASAIKLANALSRLRQRVKEIK